MRVNTKTAEQGSEVVQWGRTAMHLRGMGQKFGNETISTISISISMYLYMYVCMIEAMWKELFKKLKSNIEGDNH